MNWFWIALIPPFLFAVVNHIDKYLVDKVYRDVEPASIMYMTAIMSLLMASGVYFIKPSLAGIDIKSALILISAGIFYFCAVIPYLYALKKEEASRVAPLFQTQQIFVFMMGYFFLGEHLKLHQIVAGIVVILGAILISLDTGNGFRVKKSVVYLMLVSSLLFSLEAFLFKFVAKDVGFWSGALYQDIGAVIVGLIMVIFAKNLRQDFIKIVSKKNAAVALSFTNESLAFVSRMVFNYATLLAPLALVSLVGAAQPAFVLGIGIFLTIIFPKFGKESLLGRHVLEKSVGIILITTGTYLLLK